MVNSFPVTITALGVSVYVGFAEQVLFPGETGMMGVLLGHENTLEALREGNICIISGEQRVTVSIKEGIVHIGKGEDDVFCVSAAVMEPHVVREEGLVTQRETEV